MDVDVEGGRNEECRMWQSGPVTGTVDDFCYDYSAQGPACRTSHKALVRHVVVYAGLTLPRRAAAAFFFARRTRTYAQAAPPCQLPNWTHSWASPLLLVLGVARPSVCPASSHREHFGRPTRTKMEPGTRIMLLF